MTPAQEKVLWDFVRIQARIFMGEEVSPIEANPIARALLSVLAEEAPPVKEHGGWCVAPDGPCDCGAIKMGAAPAPKQGAPTVEDILAGLLGDMEGTHPDKTITEGRVRVWQGRIRHAINAVRAGELDRAELTKSGRTLIAENAALRERVEKAITLAKENERPDFPVKYLALHFRQILEGKGEGTEDRV